MKKTVLMALLVAVALMGCQNKTNKENAKKEEAVVTYESSDALFEAVTESINTKQDAQKSIDLVNRLVSEYPECEENSAAFFMLANFVYDEQLGDLGKARETYQLIIDNYPDSPFANDAAIAITQLGIPLDELVKMFEENAE